MQGSRIKQPKPQIKHTRKRTSWASLKKVRSAPPGGTAEFVLKRCMDAHTHTHANTQKHNAQVSTRREESKHDQLGRHLRCGTQRSVVTFSEKRFLRDRSFRFRMLMRWEFEANISPVVLGSGVTLPSSRKVWSCVAKTYSCDTVSGGPFGNACYPK